MQYGKHGDTWKALGALLEDAWALPAHDFAALERCTLSHLKKLLHANDCAIVVSARDPARQDPLGGVRAVRTIAPWAAGEARERVTRDWLRSEDWQNDRVLVDVASRCGNMRVIQQCDSAPVPGWDSSACRRLNQQLGAASRIIGARPITKDLEVHFVADRPPGEKPFSAADCETLLLAVQSLSGPATRIALSYGFAPGTVALTPREREVLALLLTPKSEKEIAADLGLGRRAAHHHVTRIYSKFAVASRAGLMSLWLAPH